MKTYGLVRLSKDPDVRWGQGDNPTCVAKFSVAEEIIPKPTTEGAKTANFYNVVCFKKLAEAADKYLRKGSMIFMEGENEQNVWTDKNGTTHYDYQIRMTGFRFAGGSKDNSASTPAPAATTDDNGFMNIPEGIDDELPFN